nr:ribonuclease H-like domain-containing protein [Tanacetum cinerariifolium]
MTGDDNHDGDKSETSNPSQPIPPPTSQLTHTVSSIKLPVLKKGEYDIWALKRNITYAIQTIQYGKFQTLLSQLEIYGADVSHEDTNQKFLRSLPSSWSQVALIMRTKIRLDTLSFDDRTNDVSTAYSFSSPSVLKSQKEGSSSYTDEVAMISMRIKKFYKRTGRKFQFDTKDPVGFDKTKVECFNCHKIGHFARDCRAKGNQDSRRRDACYNENKARDTGRRLAYQDDSKALVTIDGENIDWSGHVEEDTQNYAMMAYTSSNSGSNNETDAPIIEEYESDSDDDSVSNVQEEKETPIFAFTNTAKHVKTSRKNVKETSKPNQCPKVEKHDRNGHTRKGLGYAFVEEVLIVGYEHVVMNYGSA